MGRLLEKEYTRRDILYLGGVIAAQTLLNGCKGEATLIEQKPQISPRTLVIDTVPYRLFPAGFPEYGIDIEASHDELERGQELFGDEYVPLADVIDSYILLSYIKPLASSVYENYKEKNPERALLAAMQVFYDNHGLGVVHSMEQVYNQHSYTRNTLLYPLQELLDITFPQDEFGNIGVTFTSRMDKAALVVNRHPDKPLVNMSWQPGENTVWCMQYDEQGIERAISFQFEGGYVGETARERLQQIAKFRRDCPDHFIVSAASNVTTNYLDVLGELKQSGEMPSNGVVVGDYDVVGGYSMPLENELGPDVYVQSQRFPVRRGSSNASGMMTALLDVYMENGSPTPMDALINILKYDAILTSWNGQELEVINPAYTFHADEHKNYQSFPIPVSPHAR